MDLAPSRLCRGIEPNIGTIRREPRVSTAIRDNIDRRRLRTAARERKRWDVRVKIEDGRAYHCCRLQGTHSEPCAQRLETHERSAPKRDRRPSHHCCPQPAARRTTLPRSAQQGDHEHKEHHAKRNERGRWKSGNRA